MDKQEIEELSDEELIKLLIAVSSEYYARLLHIPEEYRDAEAADIESA